MGRRTLLELDAGEASFSDALGLPPPGREALTKVVEREAVSRLVLANSAPSILPAWSAPPVSVDVQDLFNLIVGRDLEAAVEFLDGLRARGVPLDAIYIDVLIPTARRLRRLWHDDACDLADLTVRLWRLQLLLHHYRMAFLDEFPPWVHDRRAFLAPAPGESWTFELAMIDEYFRRAGWNVVWLRSGTRSAIVESVERDHFDIVWMETSSTRLEGLASCIGAVRQHSVNEAVGIMVGSVDSAVNAMLASHVGAHGTAANAREAPLQAQRLVWLLAHA